MITNIGHQSIRRKEGYKVILLNSNPVSAIKAITFFLCLGHHRQPILALCALPSLDFS